MTTKCTTAKRLIHKWAMQVQKASDTEWQSVFFGKREIDEHRKKCKVCKGAKNVTDNKESSKVHSV